MRSARSPARDVWPLVGREPEMAVLRAAVDGSGTGVVVVGAAGAGRTRLLREAAALAESAGRTVLRAAPGVAAATVPLGAWAHLIPPGPAGATDAELLDHAAAALTRGSAHPVLVVDDAHLLDGLSVTLLHRLAAARAATLAASVADHTGDPLADLWRDDHATRIGLSPLDRAQVELLLPAALGDDVDSRTTEQLWRLSHGNLRVLREMVEGGREDGRLHRRDALWRWSGPMTPTPRLTRIVLERLAGVDPARRRALDLLAVAGAQPMPRLVALTGHDAVVGLERAGLVTVARSGEAPGSVQVHLTEPAHALVLAGELPAAEAGRIRRQVAAAAAGSPGDVAQAGRLLLDGEPSDTGPEMLLAAVDEAVRHADHVLAERLARAAADLGAGPAARVALVEALQWQGRAAEAEQVAARAWTADQHRLTAARALNLHLGLRRPDDALHLLDVADIDDTGLLAGTRALLALRSGDVPDAVRVGTEVLRRPASRAGHPSAAVAAGVGLSLQGRAHEASTALGPDRHDRPGLVAVAVEGARLVALQHAGRIVELDAGADAMHRRCLAATGSMQDAVAALHRGAAALLAGRIREAARWLTEALHGFDRGDPLALRTLCAAWLATARALLGEVGSARALLDTAEDDRLSAPQVWRARVWVAAADQCPDDAAALALDGAERAAGLGQPAVQADLLHDAVRLGRVRDAAGPLLALAVSVDTPLVAVAAEHAAALLAGAADRLDTASARFEELGALLLAADTAADAAAVYHRAGHRRRNSAAAARAARLAARCDHPCTPALRDLDRPRLTARERDVARLAATGLSNQGIAQRLVVSVRTVETHLAHAYTKLGVGGRGELAAVVEPH